MQCNSKINRVVAKFLFFKSQFSASLQYPFIVYLSSDLVILIEYVHGGHVGGPKQLKIFA